MNASVYILDDQDVSVIITALDTLKAHSLSILAAVKEKLEAPVKSGSESPASSDPVTEQVKINVNTNATTPTDDTPLSPKDVRFKGYPCEVIKKCEDIWDQHIGRPFWESEMQLKVVLGSQCPAGTTLRRWHKQWRRATENAVLLQHSVMDRVNNTPAKPRSEWPNKRRSNKR